jgi:hypothetical protein
MLTKRVSLLIVVFALCVVPVLAQDYPKAEVFGGYQFGHFENENFNGWNASATGNLNHWFGVTGDFSGVYKTILGVSLKEYTYTFGPVVTARQNGRITPFAHALFGGAHASGSAGGVSASINGFAMFFGGGADAKLNGRWAYRLAQVDWQVVHAEGSWSKNNVRVSTGIVIQF